MLISIIYWRRSSLGDSGTLFMAVTLGGDAGCSMTGIIDDNFRLIWVFIGIFCFASALWRKMSARFLSDAMVPLLLNEIG